MIIKDATIIRMDLEGSSRYHKHIRHLAIIKTLDDTKETFIRIPEEKISELETFQAGDIVDLEVEPIEWTINDLSGTSLFYNKIKPVDKSTIITRPYNVQR